MTCLDTVPRHSSLPRHGGLDLLRLAILLSRLVFCCLTNYSVAWKWYYHSSHAYNGTTKASLVASVCLSGDNSQLVKVWCVVHLVVNLMACEWCLGNVGW